MPAEFDFNEYRVIENFIVDIPSEKQKEILFNTIKGKGAFSKFRREIEKFNLLEKWREYRDEAFTEFAKEWCVANEIEFQ